MWQCARLVENAGAERMMNLQELQVHDICIIRILLSRIFLFNKIKILLSQKILTLSIVFSQLYQIPTICASNSEKAGCLSKSNFLTMSELCQRLWPWYISSMNWPALNLVVWSLIIFPEILSLLQKCQITFWYVIYKHNIGWMLWQVWQQLRCAHHTLVSCGVCASAVGRGGQQYRLMIQ